VLQNVSERIFAVIWRMWDSKYPSDMTDLRAKMSNWESVCGLTGAMLVSWAYSIVNCGQM